jgi:hypothetical protein
MGLGVTFAMFYWLISFRFESIIALHSLIPRWYLEHLWLH